MNKKVYYRGGQSKVNSFTRARRGHKMSMDDLTPLFSRPPSENKKRNSNDHFEPSKLERSTFKKNKMTSTVSMVNSVTASKTNSPLKFSMRNSQPKYPQKEKEERLKLYKFYYQIGFGGFGRVWKVYNKEDTRDYAMKEISKRRYFLFYPGSFRKTTSSQSSTKGKSSASSTTPSSST